MPSCEPWPEGGREVCAAPEQAHLPGEPGCATLARVAAGEWADGLPAAGVLYVRPGALGGTGARAEPFGTIAEAIAAASPGTIVALARGRYDEAVLVDRSLTLRGAGPATVLAPLGAAEAPAIDVTAEGVRLEDLAIAGVDRMGARVRGRGDVDASGLVVDGARDRGILVEEGGKLRIRDSIIRNLREDPSTRSAHGGLHASTGATVEMSSCLLEANLAHGALIEGPGTTASFTDTAIVDSRQDALRFFGENVFVDFGARVTLTRVVSERGHLVGVIGEGDGVELTIDDSVLRDTQDGMIGGGEPFQMPLQCGQGASCTVRGTLIERSENGLFAAYQDGTLRIERCILRDAGEQSFASRGARVEIVSSIFARTLVSAATFGERRDRARRGPARDPERAPRLPRRDAASVYGRDGDLCQRRPQHGDPTPRRPRLTRERCRRHEHVTPRDRHDHRAAAAG
ncbi:MAG: DUF1565 domain-containing protein [Sandaracinaceae bacterium]|nr:DUF1565 domain-containing protein [Sandaracinaceae bacterium]